MSGMKNKFTTNITYLLKFVL